MEILSTALLVSVLIVLVTYFSLRTRFPDLPGPSLRAYLPGGEVFPMLQDKRRLLQTVLRLSEKYGDVFQLWLGTSEYVVTSVPEDVVHIFTKTEEFVRPNAMKAMFDAVVPGSLFTLPKLPHLHTRGQLRRSFNHTHLEGFHKSMNDAIEGMCQDLASLTSHDEKTKTSDVVNISDYLATTAFRIIVTCAFGVNMSRDDLLVFASYANETITEMLHELLGYPFRQMLSVFGTRKGLTEVKAKIDAVCEKIIQDRKRESPEERAGRAPDLLDAILDLENHDSVGLTSETVVFAVAGGHTTYESTVWAIYEVARNPDVRAKIRAEIERVFDGRKASDPITFEDCEKLTYLKQVWRETLRIRPPGGFIMRKAAKDVTLRGSGITVPKGSNIINLLLGAQLNDKYWEQAESFMPERWDPETGKGQRSPAGTYAPFSLGPKNCAGQFLADYEAVLMLAALYRRFDLTLACEEEEVRSCTGWVEGARTAVDGSDFRFGLPVRVTLLS